MVTSSQTGKYPPGSNAKYRIWGTSGIFWFYTIVYLSVGAMGIWLLVGGATEKDGTAPFVTGIVILAMYAPFYALWINNFVRPLVVENGILRIPKMFGHRDIPLRTLSGVGLLYRLGSRTPGWLLQVWGDDEKPILIRRFTVTSRRLPKLAPGVKRRVGGVRDWTVPLANENTKVLESTKSGRVATLLFTSALALQGTDGPLVRSAQQKALVYDPNPLEKALAWWSPDGSMGRARGLPAPDPSKLADPLRCDVAPIPVNVGLLGLTPKESRPPETTIDFTLPKSVPLVSQDVQRARKRNALMTFASFPFFIGIGISYVLLLGHQGVLAHGEVCAAVTGQNPIHPSIVCNAWRHHQLITFVWIGSVLAIGLFTTIVFQVRATKHVVRTSRTASALIASEGVRNVPQ